jgi:hypothetical protein
MHDGRQFLEFVRLPVFERHARGLLDEDDVREIEQELMQDPTAGNVIAGTGGLRKLRYAVGGKGKSGGVRIIYFHRSKKGRLYLVTVYHKSAKDNLTKAERNEMKRLTAALDGEA